MSSYVFNEGANDLLSLKHLKILHIDISIIRITPFILQNHPSQDFFTTFHIIIYFYSGLPVFLAAFWLCLY